MSRAYKCDICGTLFHGGECVPDLKIVKYTHPFGDEVLDLCLGCQRKLEKFVANESSINLIPSVNT